MIVAQESTPAPPTGKALWMSAAGIVAATVMIIVVTAVWVVLQGPSEANITQAITVAILLQSVACCVVIWAVVRYLHIGWHQCGVVRPGHSLWHIVWQLPLSLLGLSLVNILVFSLLGIGEGEEPDQGFDFLADLPTGFILLGVLGIAVFTPLWEELFFRGIMLRDFHRRWGLVHAIVWSSLIFAAVHMFPLFLPYLFACGGIMALLRRFHGNIWGGVLLHMALNSVVCASIVFS